MADIWSLGCIIAELIKVSEPYSRPLLKQEDAKKKLTQLTHDRLLFPGDSCYPMSPYQSDDEAEQDPNEAMLTNNDQLVLICRKLITSKSATLTKKDEALLFSFITD